MVNLSPRPPGETATLRTGLAFQELPERLQVGAAQHLFVVVLLLGLNLGMKDGNTLSDSRLDFITPDSFFKVIWDTPDAIYRAVKNLLANETIEHSGRTGKRCSRHQW